MHLVQPLLGNVTGNSVHHDTAARQHVDVAPLRRAT